VIHSGGRIVAVDLVARWEGLVAPFGGGAAARAAGRALLERYGEAHRRYHTAAHLAAVLDALSLDLADDPVSVELAAWFHDAVYDPRAAAGANERDSAALAGTVLAPLGAPGPVVGEVGRLVLTTADHGAAPGDANAAVLNDADLAVLGGPPAAYQAYLAAVRAEFAWFDEPAWRAGRARVVAHLLERPRLFGTPRGADRWEARARENLAAELVALTGVTGP
jgi:predicted metal-dependent HD superfamily phosphohydrolase